MFEELVKGLIIVSLISLFFTLPLLLILFGVHKIRDAYEISGGLLPYELPYSVNAQVFSKFWFGIFILGVGLVTFTTALICVVSL